MLLYYLVATLHVLVCIILVLVVLLQSGKGADLAGAFGGAATQTAFGSRGPASFLSKMTTVVAVIFMLTSVGLSLMSTPTKTEAKSVLETAKQKSEQPAQKAPAAKPLPPVPSPEEIRRKIEELQAAQEKQAAAAGAASQEKQPATKPAEAKPPAK